MNRHALASIVVFFVWLVLFFDDQYPVPLFIRSLTDSIIPYSSIGGTLLFYVGRLSLFVISIYLAVNALRTIKKTGESGSVVAWIAIVLSGFFLMSESPLPFILAVFMGL